jgi:hypothetical protein
MRYFHELDRRLLAIGFCAADDRYMLALDRVHDALVV